jgi:predicted Zn finger-like uncharacterized protein
MKIVCESCSAKYSIADEKVAGRVFKIRCKKCGAAIVVRGDQVDGAAADEGAEASTRVVEYGGEAVWHVVVEGDQQGPFSPAQIGEMLSAGTIGWDAFVWREGFDDWKPAQEIEELVQAVMGGSQEAEAVSTDADPFAATQHAASANPDAGFGAPQAAVRAKDPGADLFAQAAASPFGGGGNDEDDDVVASAPGPRVSAEQALTGARNENSVLFSLSNLQALATGAPGGPAPSSSAAPSASPSGGPKPGMAAGEGSGLIDIRALASATGVTPGMGGPVTPANNDKVDDLLSIGGAGAVGLGSSLGAPVLIPEKKEEGSKNGVIIAGALVAVGLIAAAAVVALVVLKDDPEPPIAAAGMLPPGQTVPGATPAPTPPTAPAPAAAPTPTPAPAVAAAEPAPAAPPPAEAAPPAAPAGAAPTPSASNEGSGSSRRSRAGSGGSSAPSGGSGSGSSSTATAGNAPSGGSSRPAAGGGGGDIDDLLNQAIGGGGGRRGGASSPAAAPSGGGGNLPAAPDRAAVVSAMNSVASAVSACADGNTGLAPTRIVFGSNGRVTTAECTAQNLPGPVRSCIARAVRSATVPPFSQQSFSVNYPFRL